MRVNLRKTLYRVSNHPSFMSRHFAFAWKFALLGLIAWMAVQCQKPSGRTPKQPQPENKDTVAVIQQDSATLARLDSIQKVRRYADSLAAARRDSLLRAGGDSIKVRKLKYIRQAIQQVEGPAAREVVRRLGSFMEIIFTDENPDFRVLYDSAELLRSLSDSVSLLAMDQMQTAFKIIGDSAKIQRLSELDSLLPELADPADPEFLTVFRSVVSQVRTGTSIKTIKDLDFSLTRLSLLLQTFARSERLRKERERRAKVETVETTVEYNPSDSTYFDVIRQVMILYGNPSIKMGNKKLTASRIEIAWATNTVKAYGHEDKDGKLKDTPVFEEGTQVYKSKEMIYNFRTEKGIINGIVTEQGDGFVQGERVKKMPGDEMYVKQAIYTTCNYQHPHYGIYASRLKLVPNKYVISGPFNLKINDVPLPLGFPLGLFPVSDQRNSGIVFPQYGESFERGFFLRDGGFYLALSDYVGVKALGEFYTLGGWGTTLDVNYTRRYAFQGGFNVSYRKVVRQRDDLTDDITNDYWVRWSHNPASRGSSRFSANVNAGSSTFNRNNSMSVNNFIAPAFNSNISYSKTFEGTPFSFNANVRHNQNVTTNIVSVNPEVGLAMNRVEPFKGPRTRKSNALTNLNFSYNFNAKTDITNQPVADAAPFPVVGRSVAGQGGDTRVQRDTVDFFRNFGTVVRDARFGAVHRIPLSTNFNMFKHFQVTPNLTYAEYWYPERYSYTWVDELQAVRVDTTRGLTRQYDFNGGVAVATRLYSFFTFRDGTRIRHMMVPNISYSIKPDFSDPNWGFFQDIQTNPTGGSRRLSTALGGNMGLPTAGRSSTMSFSLDNQLEMKVRNKQDTTGKEPFKKVTLLQNFTFGSGYNFQADSLNLSDITFATRASFLNNLINVNIGGAFDPYAYVPTRFDESGRVTQQYKSREYAITQGQGLAKLSNFNIAVTAAFKPGGAGAANQQAEQQPRQPRNEMEESILNDMRLNPTRYVDFKVPWNLNINYNIRYSKPGLISEANITQTLNFNGELKLTEKWRITVTSGYDFVKKDLAFTSFNIFRDLHCWQMNMSWIPFGPRQEYSIDISVRSALLSDLKVSKRNSWFDR